MRKKSRVTVSGRVISFSDGFAEVKPELPEKCSGCGGCSTSGRSPLSIKTGLELSEGDRVTLSVECGILLRAAFYMYFFPAMLAMAGFYGGYLIGGDGGGFAGASLFLVFGYILIRKTALKKHRRPVRIELKETI